MIGFDRPLQPRWIHETLLLSKPGQSLAELHKPFETIARELTGKEGKRKARTVLFRIFLRDGLKKTVKESMLRDCALHHDLTYMTPLYLLYLTGTSETLMRISDYLLRLYSYGSEINLRFLKDKFVHSYGERDVVKRAAGAFISTLENFGVVKERNKKLVLHKRLKVNEEQFKDMLMLYAGDMRGDIPQVCLNDLPDSLFHFFSLPDIREVARNYSGSSWDYQQGISGDLLVIHK